MLDKNRLYIFFLLKISLEAVFIKLMEVLSEYWNVNKIIIDNIK